MKSPTRWVQWTIGVFCVLFWLAILFPVGSRARPNALRSRCQSNLKQIGLACLQYTQDYDRLFPPAADKAGGGWADLIVPYGKGWSLYQCPEGEDPSHTNRVDYFYNSRLVRKNLDYLKSSQQIILFGDSQDNSGTETSLSELPRFWVTADESPAKRHLEGANYAFADGHVKWIKPNNIPKSHRTEWDNFVYTFAVR